MKFKAAIENSNELGTRICITVPKSIILKLLTLLNVNSFASLNLTEVQDVLLAVVDHLVSDLDEEASHALVGVVVASNGVDHLDTVHQSR